MTFFDRAALGFLGLSTLSLVVYAASAPLDRTAYTPQATFLPPEAVPEVVAAGGLSLRSIKSGASNVTVRSLRRTFSTIKYDFDSIRAGQGDVPRVFVRAMPNDMRRIRVPAQRKQLFFQSVLPLVLKVNDEISADRRRLLRLKTEAGQGRKLPAADRLWLAVMSEVYDVNRGDLTELLSRVDVVPPSLALAQAAEESGWGTSRFVREGNALFGQWTFDKTTGLVPIRRDSGRTHRVRAFPSLVHGVRAYVRNLNTHRAYRHLRRQRAAMRRDGAHLDGMGLTGTLTGYSERGEDYVQTIQSIIRANRLEKLDRAKLSGDVVSLPTHKDDKPVI